MRLLRHIIPIGAVLASCAAAGAMDSFIRFANGNLIAGAPQSITPREIRWESPLLARPAVFPTDMVLEVSVPPQAPRQTHGHETTVTLTNGDVIRGELVAVTEDAVSLDTWFAGRLNFRRPMVAGVSIGKRTDFLYRGPTGMSGWRQSSRPRPWSFRQSSFIATGEGGISRDDLLPGDCSLSFDAAWKGDSIRLRVILFSDEPATDNPSSGYEISFQRGGVHLRDCKSQNFLGSAQSQALMEKDKVRIELRASTGSGKMTLLVDDRTIETWDDPDVADKQFGRALHFVSGSTQPLRISNIRIARWDNANAEAPGQGPAMPARPGSGIADDNKTGNDGPPATRTRMELANGDSLAGEVRSIENGIITVNTPLGEIRLPVARLRTVLLKPVDAERCKRNAGDVRCWFDDSSSVVFRLDGGGDGMLHGYSQNFGTAAFRTDAFSRIEFNIYAPDYEDLRRADDW
jgi:hypothetical protein